MNKSSCLRDGAAHCDRGRIVRPRVRTGAAASPIAKTETVSRPGTDRDSRSAVFPSTSGAHPATGPRGHGQVVLRLECRRVGRVGGWRNSVRDRAVVAPLAPYVLNACATALRRCCDNGVT
jgi:hypothetical protein